MEAIKLATPEQIKTIESKADLNNESAVLSFRDNLIVVKKVTEVDPAFFAEGETAQHKLLFSWGIESWLRLNGVQAYYFNVDVEDETWKRNLEKFGAERISKSPEYRYKKVL